MACPDDTRRIARHARAGRDVPAYNATGADQRTVTDCHALEDPAPHADETVVPYSHRCGLSGAWILETVGRFQRMKVGIDDSRVRADSRARSDCHPFTTTDDDTGRI